MDNLLRVGVITATHGLQGDVKVFPTTDDPRRYSDLKSVYLQEKDGSCRKLEIAHIRYFRQYVIVRFSGMNRIEDVEGLVKRELYVDREQAVPLQEDEYFIADLIGLDVRDEEGNAVGVLEDVMSTGANDVYIVRKDGQEILIPAIHQCIIQVDLKRNLMIVRLMEGMV